MNAEETFAASARARRGVADLLDGLTNAQLETPSLCTGWTVRTVAGHLAAAVRPSTRSFVTELVRHRGNAHAANDAVARRTATLPVTELSDRLRRYADSRFTPPVVGPRGPLADVLVHGGDMRVPLGLAHVPEPSDVRLALEFVTTGRPIGFVTRGALHGLRLVTTDLDWAWGDGEYVEGRAIDLLMLACGREALLARVTGPGVDRLTTR